jgi:hypothetical protein
MSTTRGYLTDAQYQQITGESSLGASAEAIINRAEAIIDSFIGNWVPAIAAHYDGALGAVTDASTMTLAAEHIPQMPGTNYLKGMVLEMLTGDAAGQYRTITGQTSAGLLTVDTAFDNLPAVGDIYHIYQMGKVPRAFTSDLRSFDTESGIVYAKVVPSALREAVAWQAKYMQELGDAYFDGQQLLLDSESFGGYSYTKGDNAKGGRAMIAPKARQSLSGTGIIKRTAHFSGW